MKLLSILLIGATLCFGAVDINKADKAQLMAIKGIGEAKANAVLEYRKEHKCFKNVEEIKSVKGFGDKFLEKNKSNLEASSCKK